MPRRPRAWCSKEGRRCLRFAGDMGDEKFCRHGGRRRRSKVSAGWTSWSTTPPSSTRRKRSRRSAPSSSSARSAPTSSRMFFLTKAALPHLQRGQRDRQHHLRHRVPRQPDSCSTTPRPRARSSPSRARCRQPRREAHPRERRRAGTDLDAAHPVDVPAGEGRDLRLGRAAGPRRRAGGGRAVLRLPRLRRRVVHDRPGAPPERRRDHQRIAWSHRGSPPCCGRSRAGSRSSPAIASGPARTKAALRRSSGSRRSACANCWTPARSPACPASEPHSLEPSRSVATTGRRPAARAPATAPTAGSAGAGPRRSARRDRGLARCAGDRRASRAGAAARPDGVREVRGFGERTEQPILASVRGLRDDADGDPLDEATRRAMRRSAPLRADAPSPGRARRRLAAPASKRSTGCGVVAAEDRVRGRPRHARDAPRGHPPRACRRRVRLPPPGEARRASPTVGSSDFAAAWLDATGSPDHLRKLARLAAASGLVFDDRGSVAAGTPSRRHGEADALRPARPSVHRSRAARGRGRDRGRRGRASCPTPSLKTRHPGRRCTATPTRPDGKTRRGADGAGRATRWALQLPDHDRPLADRAATRTG